MKRDPLSFLESDRFAANVLVVLSAFAIAAWIAYVVVWARGEVEHLPGVEREGWAP